MWLIVLPQLVVAVASIAGIAEAAATAFILLLPGHGWLWTAVTLATTSGFLLVGQYKFVEKAAMGLAIQLGLAGIVTAIRVFPAPAKLLAGMVPQLPGNVDYADIIPWLSFILAGAAGMT